MEDEILLPNEVAAMFRVTPKTVTRWAIAGKLDCIVTPGGHRRFRRSAVNELIRRNTRLRARMPRDPEELLIRLAKGRQIRQTSPISAKGSHRP